MAAPIGVAEDTIAHRLRDLVERILDAERGCKAKLARDAAAVLMLLIARQNGDPTREQVALIEDKLRSVFGLAHELTERMTQARFVARQAIDFYSEHVGPYAYEKLANVAAAGLNGGTEHASAIFYGERGVRALGLELERALGARLCRCTVHR